MLVSTILLTGCTTTTEKDPTMDHVQAAAELDELFAIAETAVGGEWKNVDRGTGDCTLPSGDTGAQYIFGRFGPGVSTTDQQTVIDIIVDGWAAAGFDTTRFEFEFEGTTVQEFRYPATGYGTDGLFLQFGININATDLSGQTRCVPGDSSQINQDYQDNLEQEQAELNGGG